MKVNSKSELENMLDADDRRYGLRALRTSEQDEILEKYADREYIFKKREFEDKLENNRDELIGEAAYYYYKNADVYYKHLKNTGVLELPDALSDLNFEKLLNKLNEIEPRSYICKIDTFNSNYSKAIKVLQVKLSLDDTGVFNKDLGLKIYEEIGTDISTGDGYFASENNPDFLFDYYFKEYVTYIDDYIWRKLNIESKFLVPDNDRFWTRKEDDEACEKILDYLKYRNDVFGPKEKGLPELKTPDVEMEYHSKTRVGQIIDDARNKAREKIRYSLFVVLDDTGLGYLMDYTTGNKLSKGYYSENSKVHFFNLVKKSFPWIVNLIDSGQTAFTQASATGQFPKFFEFLEIIGYTLINFFNPEPGYSDFAQDLTEPLLDKQIQKSETMAEFYKTKQDLIKKADMDFFISDIYNRANGQFLNILDRLISEMSDTKYSYSDSELETKLYNTIILLYLEKVRYINQNRDESIEWIYEFINS